MIPLAELVNGKALLDTVIYSLLAGVGVTLVFSIAVWGVARYGELSRDERPLAAGAAATVSGLALLVTAAAIVFGIIVMTSK